MSNNLNLPQLATNQASPEATVNDATAALDAALSDIVTLDLTSADATLTNAVYRSAILFKIANVSPVAAHQLLTCDGSNVNDNDMVTVGGKTYKFQTTMTNVDGNIQIGATAALSMTYLFQAINLDPAGAAFYAAAMTKNTQVTATNPTSTTVVATAIIKGVSGNAIVTTDTSNHLNWSLGTLAGGTGGGVVNVPRIKRGMVMFETDSANTESVVVVLDATQFVVEPGKLFMAYSDGNVNGLFKFDFAPNENPNDMAVFVPGLPGDAVNVLVYQAIRTVHIPAGLDGSFSQAQVGATASAVFTIKKNGSSVGTLTFAISGTVPTIVFTSDVTLDPGDTLSITAPTPQDATLADFNISIKASR